MYYAKLSRENYPVLLDVFLHHYESIEISKNDGIQHRAEGLDYV